MCKCTGAGGVTVLEKCARDQYVNLDLQPAIKVRAIYVLLRLKLSYMFALSDNQEFLVSEKNVILPDMYSGSKVCVAWQDIYCCRGLFSPFNEYQSSITKKRD